VAAILVPEVAPPVWLDPDRKNPNAMDPPLAGGATPYIQRKIDVTFALGTGDFGEGGENVVTLRGYRCYATVSKAAVGAPTTLSLRIWGMSFSQMQKMAAFGNKFYAMRNNQVRVDAGDDIAGMTMIFNGVMLDAYFDGQSQPDVAFQVTGNDTGVVALKPAPPISIAGPVDVATTMRTLATQMGLGFEDHGVDAKLRDVYYPGTAYQQARRIAEHSGIQWTIENHVLAIWPRGQGRDTGTIPLFSPDSGMKEYPTFNQQGIIVSSIFRPITLMQQIGVKSKLFDNDTYNYFPYTYTYTLESEAPNGPWFTSFMASNTPFLG